MSHIEITEAEERLIIANVELCLKCDGLEKKVDKLNKEVEYLVDRLDIINAHNELICELERKDSGPASKLRVVK